MPQPEGPLPERSNFLEGKEDREAFLLVPLPSDAIAHESIRIEALEPRNLMTPSYSLTSTRWRQSFSLGPTS